MRTLLLFLVLVLLAVPFAADAAVQVQLADGGIISAKKIWSRQGIIFVLVNRDTLLEFAPREVNMKKTFVRKNRHNKKKH